MIQVVPDINALSEQAATIFVRESQKALAHERFSVALAGGYTPFNTYRLLTQSPYIDEVPWRIVHFFWGDERWVLPSDPKSNERMARQALLDHIPVPEDQIYPMYQGEKDIATAALDYEHLLRTFFAGEQHTFDLLFLGLGENGHTASLFPESPALRKSNRWVETTMEPELPLSRLTLTAEIMNRSSRVVFLVSGREKAHILKEVLQGPRNPEQYPAQLIQPQNGQLLWLVDEAAAQQLDSSQIALSRAGKE